MSAVLFTGTPQKCRELMGQLKSGELTEGQVKELYAKAQETAKTAEQDKDTYSIYQLKHGDETRDLRFEPYDRLQVTGNVVDLPSLESCLKIWICRISAFTICAIQQLQICTN